MHMFNKMLNENYWGGAVALPPSDSDAPATDRNQNQYT